MPFPDISPIAFSIGPFAIRWYALGYLFGVGLGALYGYRLLANSRLWHKGTPPFSAKDIWDFAFWTMLAIVVGGRVGYVAVLQPALLPGEPRRDHQHARWRDELSRRHAGADAGGGAVHPPEGQWQLAERSGPDRLGLDHRIFLVRIANFINAELYGAPTTLPWGVIFPTDPEQLPRHPSQLYEAALEACCCSW